MQAACHLRQRYGKQAKAPRFLPALGRFTSMTGQGHPPAALEPNRVGIDTAQRLDRFPQACTCGPRSLFSLQIAPPSYTLAWSPFCRLRTSLLPLVSAFSMPSPRRKEAAPLLEPSTASPPPPAAHPWGRYTRLAAKILAGYYLLESFCKGLVVNPFHSPRKYLRG